MLCKKKKKRERIRLLHTTQLLYDGCITLSFEFIVFISTLTYKIKILTRLPIGNGGSKREKQNDIFYEPSNVKLSSMKATWNRHAVHRLRFPIAYNRWNKHSGINTFAFWVYLLVCLLTVNEAKKANKNNKNKENATKKTCSLYSTLIKCSKQRRSMGFMLKVQAKWKTTREKTSYGNGNIFYIYLISSNKCHDFVYFAFCTTELCVCLRFKQRCCSHSMYRNESNNCFADLKRKLYYK